MIGGRGAMRWAGWVGTGIFLSACGGGATRANLFSPEWSDDQGKSIEGVRSEIRQSKTEPGADVVVGVAGSGNRIVATVLGTGDPPWSYDHPLDARPAVAGTVVVGSGGGKVFALDARTGKPLWNRPTGGLALRGIGDDGTATAMVFGRPGGGGSVLLAVSRDGSVLRQIETERDLGVPAVMGGMAFVPWGNQYVSVVDLAHGGEAGRVLLREKTSRAWVQDGSLYFGEVGAFRFDERIKDASKNKANHVGLPTREIPGNPKWMVPGTETLKPTAGAQDRIRLFARPEERRTGAAVTLGIDADRYYATYYRFVMGLEAEKGALVWVHTHDSDILGGAASHGGVVTCDEKGKVSVFDAVTGTVVAEKSLGVPLKSCVVQADGYRGGASTKPPKPLIQQFEEALRSGDTHLHTAQRLLLRELSTQEQERVTKVLIDIASDPRAAPELVADARKALSDRRNGAPFMLESLRLHYDFLKDNLRPPPVGPMAHALAAMKEQGAAPLLASHLLDPANTEDDCREAAAALVALGSANELPALRQFFILYRAAAPTDEMALAVGSAAQGLLKWGGAEGRGLVEMAATDRATGELVRSRIELVLEAAKEGAKGDAAGGKGKK